MAAPHLHGSPLAKPTTAAHGILDVLLDAGIDTVFGIPGGTISPLYDAMLDRDIRVVSCQHETMAVYMASGWAREKGLPGVVLTTSGPGVLNAITGVAAAKEDEVPLLVLTGEVSGELAGRGALQDGGPAGLDIEVVFRPLVKRVSAPRNPQRTTVEVLTALRVAQEAPAGPCLLRLPMDVTLEPGGTTQMAQQARMLPAADPSIVTRVADALSTARRPLLLLGVGARSSNAGAAVLALAEWARCPVASDLEARGLIPDDHPLCIGTYGVGSWGSVETWLADADVVVTVGARLGDTTTGMWKLPVRPSNGRLFQIDHDPNRLALNYEAEVSVYGDLPETLRRIHKDVQRPHMALLLARDASIRVHVDRHRRKPQPALGTAPHHPRAAVAAVQRAFGSDVCYTSDIGNHLLFASEALVAGHSKGLVACIGLGGMGSGIGAAMGLAAAGRQVVAICGDGGTLMVGNELATAVQEGLPIVLAVFADRQWGMVQHGVQRSYGRAGDHSVPAVDFVGWARSLGARALRVESMRDLLSVAEAPLDGPLVLEIPIDPRAATANVRDAVINFEAGKNHA